MYGRHSGQKGYTNSVDTKGEQAEPLCHTVFTDRLFFFLLILLFRVERLPPPIITTFAPTEADLSFTFVEEPRFDVERHAYGNSSVSSVVYQMCVHRIPVRNAYKAKSLFNIVFVLIAKYGYGF